MCETVQSQSVNELYMLQEITQLIQKFRNFLYSIKKKVFYVIILNSFFITGSLFYDDEMKILMIYS